MGSPDNSSVVQDLFKILVGADNPLEQIQAAYDIHDTGFTDDAKEALLQGLIVSDPDVKLAILDLLVNPEYFGDDLVEPVSELLHDESEDVRIHAAELLGTTKSPNAIPPLVKILEDTVPEVRYRVMAALANLGDPNVANELNKYIDSDNWLDRYHAVDAIGMLGNLESTGTLLKALDDPHAKVRENAALHVGLYNTESIRNKLLEMLDDDDDEGVQAAVIYSLGTFRDKSAVLSLQDYLKTENPDLVIIATEALGKIRDPSSIPALIEMLHHPVPEVVLTIQETLDIFPNQAIVEKLASELKHDVLIRYIEHRLKHARHVDNDIENLPKKMISNLKLPMWVELLLYEVLLDSAEQSKGKKYRSIQDPDSTFKNLDE